MGARHSPADILWIALLTETRFPALHFSKCKHTHAAWPTFSTRANLSRGSFWRNKSDLVLHLLHSIYLCCGKLRVNTLLYSCSLLLAMLRVFFTRCQYKGRKNTFKNCNSGVVNCGVAFGNLKLYQQHK